MDNNAIFCKFRREFNRRFEALAPEHRAAVFAYIFYPIAFVTYAIEKRLKSLPTCVFGAALLTLQIWVVMTAGLIWDNYQEFSITAMVYFITLGPPLPTIKKPFNVPVLIGVDILFAMSLTQTFLFMFPPIHPALISALKGHWWPLLNHWILITSVVLGIWVLIAINAFSYYNNFIKKKRV